MDGDTRLHKCLPTSDDTRHPTLGAQRQTAEIFWRTGEQKPGSTSLLHNEVTRPTQHAASNQLEHKKVSTTWSYLQFTLLCLVITQGHCIRPLGLTIQHIALKITRLTKKQINRRKGNKRTIWTIKSLRR